MNRIYRSILVLLGLCLGLPYAHAQSILTPTTLSAAVTSSQQTIVVASATPNAVTGDNFIANSGIIVDGEYMTVSNKYVSGTTIPVVRGQGGTTATAHASSSVVWSGAPNHLQTKNVPQPSGSCTRTNEQYLPVVNAATQSVTDCLGGRWVRGSQSQWPPFHIFNPDTGGTAYTSINTNGTTLGATTMYCMEVNLRSNKLLTGIAVLNGTTVGTDKHLVALYDSQGNLLANSAVAGATTSGASVYQQFAFVNTAATPATGPFFAVGPAQYFACMQTNGTTDTVRMAVTGGSADNNLTKGVTSQTFGTLAAFTVPTTFTTVVGPYVYLY